MTDLLKSLPHQTGMVRLQEGVINYVASRVTQIKSINNRRCTLTFRSARLRKFFYRATPTKICTSFSIEIRVVTVLTCTYVGTKLFVLEYSVCLYCLRSEFYVLSRIMLHCLKPIQ